MKIDLKDFQITAVQKLNDFVQRARRDVRDGELHAIVLNSVTGSGKTLIITSLFEKIFAGDPATPPDPDAIFLWLSDNPELNNQSKDKILAYSDEFQKEDIIVINPSFSAHHFDSGKIFFINIQKLGKDSLLTKNGDDRQFTIWETINNTIDLKPDHFYLVLDEAHRGMSLNARQLKEAQTIVQKFILGDNSIGLSPVPIIIGMSATPERFTRLIEGSDRVLRNYTVPPDEVKESGLIKDQIILYCPEERQPSDWTMFTEAIRRWGRYAESWEKFCRSNDCRRMIDPIFIVQVEDGKGENISETKLEMVLEILEKELGAEIFDHIAHCFDLPTPVEIGSHAIRKIDPSQIEKDDAVQVVLFKMALNTGWDCPRAEVMMSFRTANDHTSIAQLVGRMVRTPLSERVEEDDSLNTVALYLPHYDKTGLNQIVTKLNDPEYAILSEVTDGTRSMQYDMNPEFADLFPILEKLPAYTIERHVNVANTASLVKLGRQLALDELSPEEWVSAKELVVQSIGDELERLRKDEGFITQYQENAEITIREVRIESGIWKEVGGEVRSVKATLENINDLFATAGRRLGEGLHEEFWRRRADLNEPNKVKIELFGVMNDQDAFKRIQSSARGEIDRLLSVYKDKIAELPRRKKDRYQKFRQLTNYPVERSLVFPDSIDGDKVGDAFQKHLYVDTQGDYRWNPNTWERKVLEAEMKRSDFLGWFRNLPRKPYSISVPYEKDGGYSRLYPDLLILRSGENGIRIDILDPHTTALADAVEKAKGLAQYAEKSGNLYDRIEIITLDKDKEIRRLDVNLSATRNKVLKVKEKNHLEALFEGS